MNRLTFEINEEGMFVKKSDVETWFVKDGIIHTGDAIRKLAEYEDLEEQQKLLKLPCAVGDTVWYWDKDRDPLEEAPFEGCIYGYEIDSSNSVLIIIKPKITFIPAWNSVIRDNLFIEDFGKSIFHTRQEAEDELKSVKIIEN